jgi:hypothetical protein
MVIRRVVKYVELEDFVRIWQRAENPAQVAAQTGMNIRSAHTKATKLRRRGVPLKHFGRGRKAEDISELVKLAKETAPRKRVSLKNQVETA